MTETTILDDSAVSEIEARATKYRQLAKRAATPADEDVIRWFAKTVRALCATVKHLRAERLEIQRILASSALNDPTEDDDPPYSTTELVEGVRFILKMKDAKVARIKELQSQLEQLRAELAEEKRLRAELKQIAQIGISEVSSLGATLKDNALIDFRSRAIQLCKDKAADLSRTGIAAEQNAREIAVINEMKAELEKLLSHSITRNRDAASDVDRMYGWSIGVNAADAGYVMDVSRAGTEGEM